MYQKENLQKYFSTDVRFTKLRIEFVLWNVLSFYIIRRHRLINNFFRNLCTLLSKLKKMLWNVHAVYRKKSRIIALWLTFSVKLWNFSYSNKWIFQSCNHAITQFTIQDKTMIRIHSYYKLCHTNHKQVVLPTFVSHYHAIRDQHQKNIRHT